MPVRVRFTDGTTTVFPVADAAVLKPRLLVVQRANGDPSHATRQAAFASADVVMAEVLDPAGNVTRFVAGGADRAE